ncbi:exported hypothetical protein [Vibrio aestuarianus]|uniref:Chitinase n=1 Tax=Vibrio aestuarianus TaxID=28171 RepID=A0ABM9FKN9_9VIBR|nr:exported hypothetical protein [Vibrio aestuarianus]CAH8189449.1 exported hypothetical protein [Vibrio aestuarianus]CAH8204906.1 exported hypothetical protein [Vibrio aestuarianus]CAH8233997.1 exported hypothetical protein [Vibrio aestuarianus]CAH8235733.1 exported hypothetical protein [Vibrio aestuarianus]
MFALKHLPLALSCVIAAQAHASMNIQPEPTPPSSDFSVWQAGVTQAKTGDKVTHNGKYFVAKNNPGVWETPTQSNWFWDEVNCQ